VGLPFDEGWTIPFDSPHFPMLPAHYRNVQMQYVFFEADPAAVARILPEPLEPDPDGLCVAVGLRVPFSTAYGAFNEAVVEERCTLDGRPGWYCSHVWHDGPRGIAAGREIYGTPKIFSELEVRLIEGTMLTRASMAGVPVITISSTLETPAAAEDLPDLAPAWRLKIIPRADRPEPAIKQLVDAGPASLDVTTHAVYRGRGTVHLEPSPLSDLTGLAPRRFLDAWFVETSYSEGFGRIDLDYLADDAARPRGRGRRR
jgi:acetoacetate decarboxylase